MSHVLPPLLLGRNKRPPLHRAYFGPGKAQSQHASDASKPVGKGAPTLMRFRTSKLAVLTGTLEIKRKNLFTCQKVETNSLPIFHNNTKWRTKQGKKPKRDSLLRLQRQPVKSAKSVAKKRKKAGKTITSCVSYCESRIGVG